MNTNTKRLTLGVEGMLPQVLIDYLWEMVDGAAQGSAHSFVLAPYATGSGTLQEILHHWTGADEGREIRKVFGFVPVTAVVCVYREGDRLVMKRSGLLEAVSLVGA